jgi:beta-galactosidase
MTAKTVEHFARVVKEYTNNEQVVGTFYGYNAFVNDILLGLHGLRFIIDSPFIDFFSSPCAYDNNRALGIDWGDMIASKSLKIHKKLYFVECDIRTHITKRMQESRPGKYPDNIYTLTDENGNKTAWCGPPTKELSLSAIRKAYIHQLTKGSGVWWFDMWGGWYEDKDIMEDLKKMKEIAESSKNKNSDNFPEAEVVMFIDEKAYLNNPRQSEFCHSVNITRIEMGNTGIPFDLCMVEDAKKVLHKYKSAIFTAPLPSESGKKAIELCKELNIPYLETTTKKPFFKKNELREILISNDVHCYNAQDNVIYCGNGFLGIHTVNDGEVKITLQNKYKIKSLFGTDSPDCETDAITFSMKKHDTAIFELE